MLAVHGQAALVVLVAAVLAALLGRVHQVQQILAVAVVHQVGQPIHFLTQAMAALAL